MKSRLNHETTYSIPTKGSGCSERNAGNGAICEKFKPGELTEGVGKDSCIPDQRVCLLHRYAHQGCSEAGETEQRLYALSAWREAPFYTERECAALEWAEALTLISENDIPEPLYNYVREHFSGDELITLTMAIIAINSWNRLAISFRTVPGSYKPELAK